MGMNLKHDFKENALAFLRGMFVNRLARFCSFWCEGAGIRLHMPDNPSGGNPNKVELDVPTAAQLIDSYLKVNRLSYSMPLEISPQMNNDRSAVASLHVYLPQTSIRIGGKTLAFATGPARGRISADGDSSAYTINGITYGSIYVHSVILDGEATDELQFDTVGSSVEGAVSLLVATVTQSGVVTQYPACLTGDLRIAGEGGDGGAKLQENVKDVSTAGEAYDISTDALLAARAPEAPELTDANESTADSISRIGTSPRAAREDHVHPLPKDASAPTQIGGYYSVTAFPGLDSGTWKRGTNDNGVKLMRISRHMPDSRRLDRAYITFRWETYDKYGALVEVSEEFDWDVVAMPGR